MTDIGLKQINNKTVKPVKLEDDDDKKKPLKGAELFAEEYANIFLVATKKSGKTSVVSMILEECTTTETTVIAFVSTLEKDATWTAIRKRLAERGIPFVGYTSLYDDHGVDLLSTWVSAQKQAVDHEETADEDPEDATPQMDQMAFAKPCLAFDSGIVNEDTVELVEQEEVKIVKPRKPKYRAPEYLFVFDDLSDELKADSITAFTKRNRHFKCKCVFSTQYVHDMKPEALKQMDYWLVFKGYGAEKLEKIHKDANLGVKFEYFERMYYDATKEPYGFLYIDKYGGKESFRKTFKYLYEIPEDQKNTQTGGAKQKRKYVKRKKA